MRGEKVNQGGKKSDCHWLRGHRVCFTAGRYTGGDLCVRGVANLEYHLSLSLSPTMTMASADRSAVSPFIVLSFAILLFLSPASASESDHKVNLFLPLLLIASCSIPSPCLRVSTCGSC